MEQRLQPVRIGCVGRPDQDLRPVCEFSHALLMNGVRGMGSEILLAWEVAEPLRLLEEGLAVTWMRHFDQCQRPFPDRLTEQIGNTVLGHDPMHVRTRYPHSFASFQHRLDPGGAIVGCGCDADYGFTARRACRTSHEGCLRRQAAIEPAFKLVYADLARQVERES